MWVPKWRRDQKKRVEFDGLRPQHGFQLEDDADAYGFPNFVKEMFFDSETAAIVISGVPGKEYHRAKDLPSQFPAPSGTNPETVLVDAQRTPGPFGQVLPSWVMARRPTATT